VPNKTFCTWSYQPVNQCADHSVGHPHGDVIGPLGLNDEPRTSGALVAVWAGDYRRQEVWFASGANIGNWYCLGGEFGRPKIWDDPRTDFEKMQDRRAAPLRPAGTVPLHPHWEDILERGPVYLLSWDNVTAYRAGWRNGRRQLAEDFQSLAEDDGGAYETADGGT
jgi:hypothetical protein